MSERTQTIHMSTFEDAQREAERIAENIRKGGATVTIGNPYENVTVRRYGLSSVDLTITEADPPGST